MKGSALPDQEADEPTGSSSAARQDKSDIKRWMWVTGAALLVVVMALGITTTLLLIDRSTNAAAQTKKDAKIEEERAAVAPQFEVETYPVRVESDLDFGAFSMGKDEDRESASLYATVQNPNEKEAATAYFDVTAYDESGSIIERTSTNIYLLPNQNSLLSGYFDVALSDAENIRIEQTSLKFAKPEIKGDVKVASATLYDDGFLEAKLTSTLNKKSEYSNLYLVGSVDDEIHMVCNVFTDIPAKADFDSLCQPEFMQVDGETVTDLPEDTKFDVLLALNIPN